MENKLEGLIERYEAVQTVNKCLAKRVADSRGEDAAINAVVLLDLLAHMVPFFARETLESLRPLFQHEPVPPADPTSWELRVQEHL
jgi:leucyl-tRNA synthetase